MRKAFVSAAGVLAVLMAVSLTFLIPSGAVTEERSSAIWTPHTKNMRKKRRMGRGILCPRPTPCWPAPYSATFCPPPRWTRCPSTSSHPATRRSRPNYTENGYRDDTIIVELEQQRMYDSDVFIAYVKIATPSQLRTAVAGQKISSSSTNLTTTICQELQRYRGHQRRLFHQKPRRLYRAHGRDVP